MVNKAAESYSSHSCPWNKRNCLPVQLFADIYGIIEVDLLAALGSVG